MQVNIQIPYILPRCVRAEDTPYACYLKQLQVTKDVNWNQVQLAYDKWDYKQEGLTGAGAAIIALAVTVVTAGAGAGAALGLNGAAAAATDAAFASLASQASVSLINNKGDVGKTLKELGRSRTVKKTGCSSGHRRRIQQNRCFLPCHLERNPLGKQPQRQLG
ncbi:hypothetical protein NX90_02305 [Neisseria meningitidis]|nr:hypothetical protein NX90_02305 [Neisseria meningitidis]KIF93417.1 hypothetical protein NX88_02240 [Neisseria meningitidis]